MSRGAAAVRSGDVAIIGMSGRFPGANSIEEFWSRLRDGTESVTVFSADDLRRAGVPEDVIAEPATKAGGVLADADCFDAPLFGMSPADAELADPQQRVFLECAVAALEDAGYGARDRAQRVGVYAGSSMSTYLLNVLLARAPRGLALDLRTLIGNDKDHLTARVAYRLGLVGPAVTVQSACSTSLVAVHLAAQAVLNGDCEMALAGGVSIAVPQVPSAPYVKGGVLARDGHCRPFDARADGIVGGSGAGVVLLKGLVEALGDGDHVRAVIRGSAINNDGRAKVGYSAPSQRGQASVIQSALAAAELEPAAIGYIEAHGTATALGDPIEIAALAHVYAGLPANSCLIGTVKSNIGHLDAAAGVAGLIKTVLCLEHGQIVPTANFETVNPECRFETTPFHVCSALTDWPGDRPRRAGVSAFGIGGTNAHVVLEEAPPRAPAVEDRSPELVVLSARTTEALVTLTARLAAHLEEHRPSLADTAFTLQEGRAALDHRAAVASATREDVVSALRDGGGMARGSATANPQVVFLFPGQGGDTTATAEWLRCADPRVSAIVDDCAERLAPHCGFDIRAAIAGDRVGPGQAYGIADTIVAQPVIFACEYALARVWMEWGITPAAMIGHSLGEYVAACLSGVLALDGALETVAARARAMQAQPEGAMLAVALDREGVATFLAAHPAMALDIAAENGPRQCVLSGPPEAIASAQRAFSTARTAATRLAARRAFHSRSMAALAGEVGDRIATLAAGAPGLPYVSTSTGQWTSAAQVKSPGFWARHTSDTVRFHAALHTVAARGEVICLEVGPGDDLTRLVKASGVRELRPIASDPPRGSVSMTQGLLAAAGSLWVQGVALDWRAMRGASRRQRVPLPTYPFARRRYWSVADASIRVERPPIADAHSPDSCLYATGWRCVATAVSREAPRQPASRLIVLHDGSDAANTLVAAIRATAANVVEVLPGTGLAVDGPGRYRIDPGRAADYVDLVQSVSQAGDLPLHFVRVLPDVDKAALSLELSSEAAAVLHLARAIALDLSRAPREVRLTLVTSGAQAVAGETVVRPLQALAGGTCRSLALEVPRLRCSCIDVAAIGDRSAMPLLVNELLGPVRDASVALRGARVFVPSLERLPAPDLRDPAPLRNDGVFLITGGLGGVGSALARYLAETVRAKLVLISRSTRDLGPTKRQRLDDLEAIGASVLLIEADVSSVDDLTRARDAARRRFGPINGIVHAAGVAASGMILAPQDAALDAVCRAKVNGTLALSRVFRNTPLDLVTLCSSLASVLGAPAQAAYAAANAFLDVVPYTDLFPGARVQTINWDTWRDAGMAVDLQVPASLEARRQDSLRQGVSSAEGASIYSLILAGGCPRVVVSTIDPGIRARARAATPWITPVEGGVNAPARPASVRLGDRMRGLEDDLCRLWADALRLPAIAPDDNVFELGADSLVALQVIATIEQRFGCALSPVVCYEAPTARLLARLMTDVQRDEGALAQSEARGLRRQRGSV